MPDGDDGTWHEGQPVKLFAGQPPQGWQRRADGVLFNTSARASALVSRERFTNFRLHTEFRLPKRGNSGIGLRNHYELQLADDFGEPPDLHGNVSLYSQIAPRVNASRRAGEWQSVDLTLVGRDLTVVLNGITVMDHAPIRGLTGMAENPNEEQPGPISLQGDHGGVEFRNVVVTPLLRK